MILVMKTHPETQLVRLLLLGCIIFSVTLMYNRYLVRENFAVVTNPDGRPTLTE